MNIPFIDLQQQFKEIKKNIEPIILDILNSQQCVLGKYNKLVENKVSELCQCQYAIPVASGTDALILALKAADLPENSEVITTSYSFFASASSIVLTGLKPVFVDIDSETYNIDQNKIEEAISENTKAILPVHLYGQCSDMEKITEIAENHNLIVIEDVAQSILAEAKGRNAGSMGLAGTLSFYPSKNLGAFGDAGMVLTNNDSFYERVKMLHVHGSKGGYIHETIGYNSRMDEIQAAAIYVKSEYIRFWTAKKEGVADYYNQLFKDSEILTPSVTPGYRHVYNSYIINVDKRDGLKEHLSSKGISTSIFYPLPLPYQPCFKELGYNEGDFPNAESASKRTLAIPCYAELTKKQQEYVAENILNFYK